MMRFRRYSFRLSSWRNACAGSLTAAAVSLTAVAAAILLAGGCRKWTDHIAVNDPSLQENLFQRITADSSLSKFSALLVSSGYDKVIASSKTFTVWAPRNAALQNLDPAIAGDPAKLQQFVGNHICNQSYLTTMATTPLRLKMLNGKYVVFSSTKFDVANITVADRYVRNGILQVIDTAIVPLPNIWEYVNSTTAAFAQHAFLLSLNFTGFDSAKATLDSINPLTGQPVYVPGTGLVPRNTFTDAYSVNNEDSVYTYFVMQDANFNSSLTAQKPYFATSSADSTTNLSGWNVVRDLAVKGLYTPDQLPDTLLSKYNVRIPVVKSAIVGSYKMSNGIVYVMSSINFLQADKIHPLVIRGETPIAFSRNDKGSSISHRLTINPLTGQDINQLYVFNVGGVFTVEYQLNKAYSTRYHVYWVAVNDLQTTAFSQRIAMDSSLTTFPYVPVPVATPQSYNEVYIGDYTTTSYGSHYVYLINTNSATSGVNTLALNYVKLIPF